MCIYTHTRLNCFKFSKVVKQTSHSGAIQALYFKGTNKLRYNLYSIDAFGKIYTYLFCLVQ